MTDHDSAPDLDATAAPDRPATGSDPEETTATDRSDVSGSSAIDPIPSVAAASPPVPASRRARLLRAAAIAFTAYHLCAVLVGGMVSGVRRHVSPVFGFYAEGLKMTNSWGMFGKPPLTNNVVVEAEKKDGTKIVLSTTRGTDRPLFERIRDVRIRKIQSRLAEAERNRLGPSILDYFCRTARDELGGELRGVRAIEIVHELKNDDGVVTRTESKKTILTRWCGDKTRPVVKPSKLPSWMKSVEDLKDGQASPGGEGDS